MPAAEVVSEEEQSITQPLSAHPHFERVASLNGPCKAQIARNKRTGDFATIRFLKRGFDADTAARIVRTTVNHMELSTALHPHILTYKETFLTNQYLAMVAEYIEGETIEAFLEKVGGKVIEGLARFIFQQLIIALDYCHQRHKILRDIKLCNVLLSICEGQLPLLKLCDFSVSKDLTRDLDPHSQECSILYAAPEVLQNASGGFYDGKAADIWSVGIVLYVMLFGRHPFMRDEDAALSQEHRMVMILQRTIRGDAEYPESISAGLSNPCTNLLAMLLQPDAGQRINMRQIMSHPWFLEALPDGAMNMNRVFLAESRSLTPGDVAAIQAIIHKASSHGVGSPSCLPTPSNSMAAAGGALPSRSSGGALPSPSNQQQLSGSRQTHSGSFGDSHPTGSSMSSGGHAFHNGTPLPSPGGQAATADGPAAGGGGGGGGGGGMLSCVATPLMPQQQLLQAQQQQQHHYHIQQLQASGGGGLDHVPREFFAQTSLRRGLMELEDALMAIPSAQLKAAATEDIRRGSFHVARFDSMPSPVAPRTVSELEKTLMGSPSFVREYLQAGAAALAECTAAGAASMDVGRRVGSYLAYAQSSGYGAGPALGAGVNDLCGAGGNGAAELLPADAVGTPGAATDCSELLDLMLPDAEPPLPGASFSAMHSSFDFQLFNRMFEDMGQPSLTQQESTWAKICLDASERVADPLHLAQL